jgi:hypothetical protein
VISSVVFCPQAPVLVPDIAQGAAPELDDLRAACRAAIRRAVPKAVRPVLVGAGPTAAEYPSTSRGTFAGFGLPLEVPLGSDDPGPVELPPTLTVGAWLLRDALGAGSGAVAHAVPPEGRLLTGLPDKPTSLIVVGDGSARRTEKAPGYLDERAAAFDAAVADIFRQGDGSALNQDRLERYGASDLLVSGLPAWHSVHSLVANNRWEARLLYAAAPYGVGYFVAVWTRFD